MILKIDQVEVIKVLMRNYYKYNMKTTYIVNDGKAEFYINNVNVSDWYDVRYILDGDDTTFNYLVKPK